MVQICREAQQQRGLVTPLEETPQLLLEEFGFYRVFARLLTSVFLLRNTSMFLISPPLCSVEKEELRQERIVIPAEILPASTFQDFEKKLFRIFVIRKNLGFSRKTLMLFKLSFKL